MTAGSKQTLASDVRYLYLKVSRRRVRICKLYPKLTPARSVRVLYWRLRSEEAGAQLLDFARRCFSTFAVGLCQSRSVSFLRCAG